MAASFQNQNQNQNQNKALKGAYLLVTRTSGK